LDPACRVSAGAWLCGPMGAIHTDTHTHKHMHTHKHTHIHTRSHTTYVLCASWSQILFQWLPNVSALLFACGLMWYTQHYTKALAEGFLPPVPNVHVERINNSAVYAKHWVRIREWWCCSCRHFEHAIENLHCWVCLEIMLFIAFSVLFKAKSCLLKT